MRSLIGGRAKQQRLQPRKPTLGRARTSGPLCPNRHIASSGIGADSTQESGLHRAAIGSGLGRGSATRSEQESAQGNASGSAARGKIHPCATRTAACTGNRAPWPSRSRRPLTRSRRRCGFLNHVKLDSRITNLLRVEISFEEGRPPRLPWPWHIA